MDEIHEKINECFKQDCFQSFLENSQDTKLLHRCLDGFGINYNKKEITKIKAYTKILDYFPKFSNKFLGSFLLNDEEREAFFKFCNKHSDCLLDRSTGLSGFNLAIKKNLLNNQITRSVYIKKRVRETVVLNFGEEITYFKYKYIFSKTLINYLSYLFRYPKHEHGLELSFKEKQLFATVYPTFSFKSLLKPSDMGFSFDDYFMSLHQHNTWNIEDEILTYCFNNNSYLRPITKGYGAFGKTRKIYIGAFSYKHSAFKNLII